ncbi:hypothetical protein EDD26_1664 [Agrococcus jenensis]|uniref:Uncharacterized protein n=1 Tax=Agrococcus jenensis TaxID=46353 RepID=A0A3N2AU41_9MICO|nr:hypothetical protein EDD26_1664 [Agrococcus jenensis]
MGSASAPSRAEAGARGAICFADRMRAWSKQELHIAITAERAAGDGVAVLAGRIAAPRDPRP